MNAPTLFVLVSVVAAGVVYATPQPQIISIVFAVLAGFVTYLAIPSACGIFLNAGLKGRDLNKTDPSPVPESLGVICGAIYLIFMFLFLPIPFMSYWFSPSFTTFPHFKLLEFLAALLSICCMIFLGFADDVLNLRWRNKLYLPTIASLPLLMVYMLNIGSTNVIIPTVLSELLGMSGNVLYLGVLYYVYMGMLAVFCTNAINIFAGINGVEAGQSLIIGISILINNLIQIFVFKNPNLYENHLFSVYFILPFITITIALLYYNWYPSRVFVGDTFCYFAGMTFAVVGILGHFSKTMLLFFIPQVFNFVYSVPQLFGLVPCPRHRLPKFDPKTGKLGMSFAEVKVSELKWTGNLVLSIGKFFRLIHVEEIVIEDPDTKKKAKGLKFNNLTIINFVLLFIGPTHEARLTFYMLLIQSFCTVIALLVRFKAAALFYDVVE